MFGQPAGRLISWRCRHGRRGAGPGIGLGLAVVVFFSVAALPGLNPNGLAAAPGAGLNPAAEVPAGHWAYRDLDVLARADLLTGVVVGGVLGTTLTRSEFAWMVEGVLEYIGGPSRVNRMLSAAAGSHERRGLDELVDEAVTTYNKTHRGKSLDDIVKASLTRLTVEFWREMENSVNEAVPESDRPGTARYQDLDAVARRLEKPTLPPQKPEKPPGVVPPGVDNPAIQEQLKDWQSPDRVGDGSGTSSGKFSSLVFRGGAPAEAAGNTAVDAPGGGDVDLGGGTRVGAGYFRLPREGALFLLDDRRYEGEDAAERGLARLSGRVMLAPGLDVFGEYLTRLVAAHSAEADAAEPGAVNVGANVKLGLVEIGASYRGYGEGAVPALTGEQNSAAAGSDVNVSVKVGDLRVRTALLEAAVKRTAALGLEYSFGNAVTVNAGYRLVDLDALGSGETAGGGSGGTGGSGGAGDSGGAGGGGSSGGTGQPGSGKGGTGTAAQGASSVASLGVGVNINDRARVTAQVGFGGLTAEGPGGLFAHRQAQAGVEIELPWNTRLMADYALSGSAGQPWKSNASLGLGYSWAERTSFLLGYRMIDFGDEEVDTSDRRLNLATAELKIRF